jgi:spore germination protein PC
LNGNIYQYMKELHAFIDYQANKVSTLEKKVNELQQEIVKVKERPPVQVGNIEYKFDQLKVETLEGTLNIGLNPSDLEGISDFTVENQNLQTPKSPKNQFKIIRNNDIEGELREFLESRLPHIYEEAQEKLDYPMEESYYSLIKEDIMHQLPHRISAHLDTFAGEERELNEAGQKEIVDKIKNEIREGVFLFLRQLQQQAKGESD